MGTHNKQRRREKAARRRAEHARRQGSRGWSQHTRAENCDARSEASDVRRIREALWSVAGIRRDVRADVRADFSLLETSDFEVVAAEAESQLGWLVGQVWHDGWQPSELARHARRADPRLGRVVAALIVADHAGRDPATVHPRWREQVTAIASDGVRATPPGWLHDALTAEEWHPAQRLLLAVKALGLLATIRSLPPLLPPPGSDPATWDRRERDTPADDPVLAKVRALLAQAESTTFEAEAEAFTAKAQELIARHSIDAALLWASTDRTDRPVTIRLPIDDPYSDQKSQLLHVVAKHSRCKAVMHAGCGLESVIGFAADVAAVELLFTSLLVQSQAAMQAEAAGAPPGAHTRGRAFRASFLRAYACRIDKRLAEVNRTVEHAAVGEHDSSTLLPVLAARSEAIDEEIAVTFGELSTIRRRGGTSDALGWHRGMLAADRAQLYPDLPPGG